MELQWQPHHQPSLRKTLSGSFLRVFAGDRAYVPLLYIAVTERGAESTALRYFAVALYTINDLLRRVSLGFPLIGDYATLLDEKCEISTFCRTVWCIGALCCAFLCYNALDRIFVSRALNHTFCRRFQEAKWHREQKSVVSDASGRGRTQHARLVIDCKGLLVAAQINI